MKKSLVIVFTVLLCLVMGTPKAQAQGFNPTLAAQLQSTLDSLMALLTNTKGMSASVYCPGQGIWNGASGLSHGGQPISTNMRFGIASNSKLFTAVVMLKLAESNVLTLEDSLHEWIPNYNNINPDITIRQLLNHSSGISDPFFTTALLDSIGAHPTHQYTIAEVLALLGPPVFAPGGGYNYSNINYVVAGMVAEAATGFHISRLIRDSILTPLQMDSTFYDLHEPESLPIAHRWENNVDFNDTSRISLNSAGGASGSLFTTPSEFVQWYHALMDGQVISQASLAEMTNFTGSGNYGLGISLSTFFGNATWGHGGSTIGYKSRAIYDPCRKVAVFGVANSTPSAVDGITALLYKVIVDKLPACPAAISGQQSVCQNTNGITYTVPAIANSTSYVWNLPNGVTGVSNTNSITVNFGPTAVSGTISASGSNGYGVGSPSTFHVTVLPTHTITENQSICSGESIQWEGSTIFLPGQYSVALSSIAGCDSTRILNLSVTSVPNGVTLSNTTLSADSVWIPTNGWTATMASR
jgi:D-alanyl-D-alanine carboxypeptidase